ncbi:hypothetical protein OF83DRAFT_1180665 [Amylostereum chailletii]|nr:hypothetical protein OF83DRAFT_1180665 [Amylostereum chailletii]
MRVAKLRRIMYWFIWLIASHAEPCVNTINEFILNFIVIIRIVVTGTVLWLWCIG